VVYQLVVEICERFGLDLFVLCVRLFGRCEDPKMLTSERDFVRVAFIFVVVPTLRRGSVQLTECTVDPSQIRVIVVCAIAVDVIDTVEDVRTRVLDKRKSDQPVNQHVLSR